MKAAYFTQTGPPDVIHIRRPARPKAGPHPMPCAGGCGGREPDRHLYSRGPGSFQAAFPVHPGPRPRRHRHRGGPGAKRFNPGDRVWATNQGLEGRPGTFCELAAVDERWLYPIPAGCQRGGHRGAFARGMTAHLGLVRDAQLKAGEILFVNGGRAASAPAWCRWPSNRRHGDCHRRQRRESGNLPDLGADWRSTTRPKMSMPRSRELAPGGVNVWWETLREPDFERAIPLLAMRGRMVLMAGRDARPLFP